MTTVAVIEARSNATRLPYKVLRPLARKPMLHWVVRRAALAGSVDAVVVATPAAAGNGEVLDVAAEAGAEVVTGPMDDVLARDIRAAAAMGADTIVRLTGDNPFVDPLLIDQCVAAYTASDLQFVSTCRPGPNGEQPTYPRGIAVEVVGVDALLELLSDYRAATREHVTPPLYEEGAEHLLIPSPFHPDWRDRLRLTVDTPEDYMVAGVLYDALGPMCRLGEVIAYCEQHPDLPKVNAGIPVKPIRG